MSRDARMEAVDALPGGLHSTPEHGCAGAYQAETQQAQAALRAGRLLHAAAGAQRAGRPRRPAASRRIRAAAPPPQPILRRAPAQVSGHQVVAAG